MIPKTDAHKELKKLWDLLEYVRQKKLGLDWQSKLVYKDIEEQIVNKIKVLKEGIKTDSMVK